MAPAKSNPGIVELTHMELFQYVRMPGKNVTVDAAKLIKLLQRKLDDNKEKEETGSGR